MLRDALAMAAVVIAVAGCTSAENPGHDDTPYRDGVLPVGDGKYTSIAPEKGLVFLCPEYEESLSPMRPGAQVRGPWFTPDGTGWNPSLKPHIQGDIPVTGTFEMRVTDEVRTIATNSLPLAHTIGIFPVAPSDPAYAIDPNPNTAMAQDQEYSLVAHPKVSDSPGCVGHQVGVMTRGAALFSPLDAQGRDAVAWEIQDHCSGHPDPMSTYHYHGPSPCLPGTDTNAVIGFALDGFPITGNRDSSDRELFSRDLDECHGSVAEVELDGSTVSTYRYAMTRDFPYTVACFRGGYVEDR